MHVFIKMYTYVFYFDLFFFPLEHFVSTKFGETAEMLPRWRISLNLSPLCAPTFLSGWRETPPTDAPVPLMPWPRYEERRSFSKVPRLKPRKQMGRTDRETDGQADGPVEDASSRSIHSQVGRIPLGSSRRSQTIAGRLASASDRRGAQTERPSMIGRQGTGGGGV